MRTGLWVAGSMEITLVRQGTSLAFSMASRIFSGVASPAVSMAYLTSSKQSYARYASVPPLSGSMFHFSWKAFLNS